MYQREILASIDNQPLDLVGNEIKEGDLVAFATRFGNAAELHLRRVLQVKCTRDDFYDPKQGNHGGWVNGNVYSLSIVSLEATGRWTKNAPKPATTLNLTNCLVLQRKDGTKLQ